jgi:hypothetical protein
MGATLSRINCLVLAGFFAFLSTAGPSQKKTKQPKKAEAKVENYYGGVFLVGDGGIPSGPCFRINGRVTSAGFFNELKSYGTDDGTIFRLGTNEVTQFPTSCCYRCSSVINPCSTGLQPVGTGAYLTQGSDEFDEAFVVLETRRGSAACGKNYPGALFHRSHRAVREGACGGIAEALSVVVRTGNSQHGRSSH